MTMSKVKSRWPLSPATVRAVLSGHGILGLAFAAVIYLVCLSGTLTVFVHDLERWEQPARPVVSRIDDTAMMRALDTARAQVPTGSTLYASLPSAGEPGAEITAYSPTFEREWSIDAHGALLEKATAFSEFVVNLHIALHLPRSWGEFIVGLAGVALLSSLVSGILAHPRILKDAFHLRRGGSRRLQEADLHNRLGIWTLPFHVVIALTGALLGLSTLIVGVLAMLLYRGDTAKVYGLFIDAPPAANASPAPLPPLAALLVEARRRAPGAEPHQLIIENAGRADARITVTSERLRLLVPQDTTSFDSAGRVLKDRHPRDLAAGTKILGGIGQLHFGWYGGLPVRIIYGLLGLALCVLTSSGVTIWLARRRDRGRAVPQWERLWASVAWGQPLAFTLAALVTIAVPTGGAALWTWLVATMALLLGCGALRFPATAIAHGLRLALAVAMITLGASHLAIYFFTPASLGLDILLLIGGGVIFLSGKYSRASAIVAKRVGQRAIVSK
ncbi:PepSY-associated TM helix domain-containing protein [Sphingomonas sp. PP-CC-3G-468]|uniref:PepSY-associated TM helix domain-containing protein n=1 Tax=Sphingomonas sp. PP-CC-3G-468 TaxID=2135656 RepID=UPI0010456209|nr:PepSY-associated TM helix domain-containing protein [Sphingomonas sp. PP-CC-3G-468]TCM04762.1 putative iron-regulated membrane protein [Sphingomonas sp. PP-CC-3G-468]